MTAPRSRPDLDEPTDNGGTVTTQTRDPQTPQERSDRIDAAQAELDQLRAERDGRAPTNGPTTPSPTLEARVDAAKAKARSELQGTYLPAVMDEQRRRAAAEQARARAQAEGQGHTGVRMAMADARNRIDNEIAAERNRDAARRTELERDRRRKLQEASDEYDAAVARGGSSAQLAAARSRRRDRIPAIDAEYAEAIGDLDAAERAEVVRLEELYVEQAGERARAEAQAEIDAAESVPASATADPAEIDADPEVAALEARIAAGDESVTADDLTAARTAAAGRGRFARLRDAYAAKRARQAAEQAEIVRLDAARRAARDAVDSVDPAAVAKAYDAAVAAVIELVAVAGPRSAAIRRLAAGQGDHVLPATERDRAAGAIVVDGETYRAISTDPAVLVTAALAAAGVAPKRDGGIYVGSPVDDPPTAEAPSFVMAGRPKSRATKRGKSA